MASSRGALRAALAVSAVCGLLSFPAKLHAEPSDAQKETARNLMAQGRAQRDRSDLTGALASFRAADAIMGVPTTAYELASAQAELELLVEARTTIRRLLTAAPKANEPLPFQLARTKAVALDAEVDARIASLRFALRGTSAEEGVDVFVDGEAIARAAVAMPYRVNPGHHVITARTTGKEAKVEVDLSERQSLEVPLRLAPVAPSALTPAPPPAHLARVPRLSYVAGGIGAAGLIVGGVTGVLALSRKHSAQSGCRANLCPPSTWSDLDRAHSYATVSSVGFIVGAVGFGVALGGFFAARGGSDSGSLHAQISTSNSGGSFSLSGRF